SRWPWTKPTGAAAESSAALTGRLTRKPLENPLTPAAAVAAPVLGARAARLGDAFLQRFARAEQAHAGVARRQSALAREGLDRQALHIHRLERVGVLGLWARRQTADAGTDLTVDLGVGRLMPH